MLVHTQINVGPLEESLVACSFKRTERHLCVMPIYVLPQPEQATSYTTLLRDKGGSLSLLETKYESLLSFRNLFFSSLFEIVGWSWFLDKSPKHRLVHQYVQNLLNLDVTFSLVSSRKSFNFSLILKIKQFHHLFYFVCKHSYERTYKKIFAIHML